MTRTGGSAGSSEESAEYSPGQQPGPAVAGPGRKILALVAQQSVQPRGLARRASGGVGFIGCSPRACAAVTPAVLRPRGGAVAVQRGTLRQGGRRVRRLLAACSQRLDLVLQMLGEVGAVGRLERPQRV